MDPRYLTCFAIIWFSKSSILVVIAFNDAKTSSSIVVSKNVHYDSNLLLVKQEICTCTLCRMDN